MKDETRENTVQLQLELKDETRENTVQLQLELKDETRENAVQLQLEFTKPPIIHLWFLSAVILYFSLPNNLTDRVTHNSHWNRL